MVSHQLARGLKDVSIQERVLALAATEKKLDLTKIVDNFILRHTNTTIFNRYGVVIGIALDLDRWWSFLFIAVVCNGKEPFLVACIGGVRDQLTEENLLLLVKRVDDDIHQT